MTTKIESIVGIIFGILVVALAIIVDAGIETIVVGSLMTVAFIIMLLLSIFKK